MSAPERLNDVETYTIGWIAALPYERAAATAMLDERHDPPENFEQHIADDNAYTWGRMGRHHLVIASLPAGQSGLTAATTTAEGMRSSLPHIRAGLLVGVGSGIPRLTDDSEPDIRLGDIIVGQPQGQTGGVVQYDLAQANDGLVNRIGFLNSPPRALTQALAKLQAEHELSDSLLSGFFETMIQKHPRMAKAKAGQPSYLHPGSEYDRLFGADCPHTGARDCRSCPASREISRLAREDNSPVIHYGIIASGNLNMEDAATRDSVLARLDEDCLCFETQAAGLLNSWPCLVIRGISDYADSHKNDTWQRYAAAVAAAFAKELMVHLDPIAVKSSPKLHELLGEVAANTREIRGMVSRLSEARVDDHIQQWLAPANPTINYQQAMDQHHVGTGDWFISGHEFRDWLRGERQFLWVCGLAGSGKTVLSSLVVSTIQQSRPDHPLLYFYFTFRENSKQTLDSLLRSLLSQLAWSRPSVGHVLSELSKKGQPTTSILRNAFDEIVRENGPVIIVIDALDESESRRALLDWIKVAMHNTNVRMLVTSRDHEDISSKMQQWMPSDSKVELLSVRVDADIGTYVREVLWKDDRFERWKDQSDAQQLIEHTLTTKAKGMFRWAALQLDALEQCLNRPALQRALDTLPATLGETYTRMLDSIPFVHFQDAIRLLQVLVGALESLSIPAMVDALAVDLDSQPRFDIANRIKRPRDIARLCPGLVRIHESRGSCHSKDTVELAHFSVKEFLTSPEETSRYHEQLREPGIESIMAKICIEYFLTVQTSVRDGFPAHEEDRRLLWRYEPSMPRRHQSMDLGEEKFLAPGLSSGLRRTRTKPAMEYASVVDKYPFIGYCVRYWYVHAGKGEASDESVRQLEIVLLSSPTSLKRWRTLLSVPFADTIRLDMLHERPLHAAVWCGLSYATQHYLDSPAEPDAPLLGIDSAFLLASSLGHLEIMRILLDAGANVNCEDGDAIRTACDDGRVEVVQLLISRCASVNAPGALQCAYEAGHHEIVDLLIKNGAGSGKAGSQTLLEVCDAMYNDLVQKLVSGGVDVRLNQSEALCLACDFRVNPGLGMAGKTFGKYGFLHGADNPAFGERRELITIFVEAGADVDAQDGKPLRLAYEQNNTWLIDTLIRAGASLPTTLRNVKLVQACKSDSPALIQLLIESDADVLIERDAALIMACTKDQEDIAKVLLHNGADPNTGNGRPLTEACQHGSRSVIEMLLARGAYVFGEEGDLALSSAFENGEKVGDVLGKLFAIWTKKDDQMTAMLGVACRNADISAGKILLREGAQLGENEAHSLLDALEGKLPFEVHPAQLSDAGMSLLCTQPLTFTTDGALRTRALHVAVSWSSLSGVSALLQCGADVSAVDGERDENALHLAAKRFLLHSSPHDNAVIQKLVAADCTRKTRMQRDSLGWTPIDLLHVGICLLVCYSFRWRTRDMAKAAREYLGPWTRARRDERLQLDAMCIALELLNATAGARAPQECRDVGLRHRTNNLKAGRGVNSDPSLHEETDHGDGEDQHNQQDLKERLCSTEVLERTFETHCNFMQTSERADGLTLLHFLALNLFQCGPFTKDTNYADATRRRWEYCVILGADINARDVIGRTPLHCAVSIDTPLIWMLRIILSNGVDREVLDNDGLTARDYVCRKIDSQRRHTEPWKDILAIFDTPLSDATANNYNVYENEDDQQPGSQVSSPTAAYSGASEDDENANYWRPIENHKRLSRALLYEDTQPSQTVNFNTYNYFGKLSSL